jgi:hypothetical protein
MENKLTTLNILTDEDFQVMIECLKYIFPDIALCAINEKETYISCENDGKEINS